MENKYTKALLSKLSTIISENDCEDDPQGSYNEEGVKYTVLNEGAWEVSYKDYANKETIFHFTDLNLLVCANESRSGSYYGDYNYDEPTFCFVVEKEVTTTIFVPVKFEDN